MLIVLYLCQSRSRTHLWHLTTATSSNCSWHWASCSLSMDVLSSDCRIMDHSLKLQILVLNFVISASPQYIQWINELILIEFLLRLPLIALLFCWGWFTNIELLKIWIGEANFWAPRRLPVLGRGRWLPPEMSIRTCIQWFNTFVLQRQWCICNWMILRHVFQFKEHLTLNCLLLWNNNLPVLEARSIWIEILCCKLLPSTVVLWLIHWNFLKGNIINLRWHQLI